jgi:hypothetical protein
MQQWYKTDVVKRFYLYHAMQSVLQLENISEKILLGKKEWNQNPIPEKIKTKNYREIQPVITIVWFVQETLGFKDIPYVNYILQTEELDKLINIPDIEKKSKKELVEEIKKIQEVSQNNTKELDFLKKNKLAFYFQKNIIEIEENKNKINKNLYKWFQFAQRSLDKENQEEDFMEFQSEKHFNKLTQRLQFRFLDEEDKEYIIEEEEYTEMVKRYELELKEEGKKEGKVEGIVQGKAEGIAQGIIQGKTEGITQGKVELLYTLLELKNCCENLEKEDFIKKYKKLGIEKLDKAIEFAKKASSQKEILQFINSLK